MIPRFFGKLHSEIQGDFLRVVMGTLAEELCLVGFKLEFLAFGRIQVGVPSVLSVLDWSTQRP